MRADFAGEGPDGGTHGLCAKCGGMMSGELPDPQFALERIEQIKTVPIEPGAVLVPTKLHGEDDHFDGAEAQGTVPPQTAQIAELESSIYSRARLGHLRDRELRDFASDHPHGYISL